MAAKIKTDLGNDIFELMRRENYYYIDKTLFIKEFLEKKGRVNLITRPRRFGKSLNFSMLKSFLEIGADPALFKGLDIEGEKEICEKHFGKYPVLHLSLPARGDNDFKECMNSLSGIIGCLFDTSLKFLKESGKLSSDSKKRIEDFSDQTKTGEKHILTFALQDMVNMLYEHYSKEVVILIDEYDSMVTHAIGKGYEKELCEFLSGFFGGVFKSNGQVEFVALTGCLSIAKESIFSGANNLKVSTVSDLRYSGSFGLTEEEVSLVLDDFGLSGSLGTFRDWYDGYLFRSKRIYNTWSVLSYCVDLWEDPSKTPQSYWASTSNNDIIFEILDKADSRSSLAELEKLVFGGTTQFYLESDINIRVYHELSAMWSVLVHSGYLTPCEESSNEYRIPNKEIKKAFVKTVLAWVQGRVSVGLQNHVVDAIWETDTNALQAALNTIFFDAKEYAYHMILLGVMVNHEIKSNGESGDGLFDIALVKGGSAAILEMKKSPAELYMLSNALRGIMQIRDRRYGVEFEIRGFEVIHYGISFFKKGCFVLLEKTIDEDLIDKAIGDMEAAIWGINWKIDKDLRTAYAKKKTKPPELPPEEKFPNSENWYPDRVKELALFQDFLDSKTNFNFVLFRDATTKLLRDLNWLLETEKSRADNQTLLDMLLIKA